MDKIIEFLLEDKRNTYAGKKKEEKPSRLNSHDLKYEKDNLFLLISLPAYRYLLRLFRQKAQNLS